MQYLLDTVTIVQHFAETGKPGRKAQKILNSTENTYVISVISLMEMLYLSEKRRIGIDLKETLSRNPRTKVRGTYLNSSLA